MKIYKISFVNESTLVDDTTAKKVMLALQKQVSNDFAKEWGIDVELNFFSAGEETPDGCWQLIILDNSDQAGDLGYHDLTSSGLPLGKIFVAADLRNHVEWSVTASHELLEMLADPDVNLTATKNNPDGSYLQYQYEVCDACENDQFAYPIDNVKVSDFVFPSWFEQFHPSGTRYDYQRKITEPFQLLDGGFINVYDGTQWMQLHEPPARLLYSMRPQIGSRRERRRTPRNLWMKSKKRSLKNKSKKIILSALLILSFSFAYSQKNADSNSKNDSSEKSTKGALSNSQTEPLTNKNKNSVEFHKSVCNPDITNIDEEFTGIIYDFKTKTLWKINKGAIFDTEITDLNNIEVRRNQQLKIKVINVNRYLYNVDLTADDVIFGSEQPAMFSQFFGINSDIVSSLIEGLKSKINASKAAAQGDQSNPVNEKMDIFLEKLRAFLDCYNQLLDKQVYAYNKCFKPVNCCENKIDISYSEVSNLMFDLRLSYATMMATLNIDSNDIEKLRADKKFLEEKPLDINKLDPKKDKKKRKAIFDQTIKIKDCEQCTNSDAIKSAIVDKGDQIRIAQSEIALANQLGKFKEQIDSLDDDKLLKAILFANNFNASNYFYTSPPIYPQGNRLKLSLAIFPRATSKIKDWDIMPFDNDTLSFEIRLRKTWTFNFSTGPFACFDFNGSLASRNYEWIQHADNGIVTDSSNYKLENTGRKEPPIGLSAFANTGCKLGCDWADFSFSVGVGLPLNKPINPVYMGGVSFGFGLKQQLRITGGVAFTQVEKLDPDVYNSIYSYKPEDVKYNDVLKSGWFLALTYTLPTIELNRKVHSNSK